MSEIDKPNVVLPLAESYNTRGQNAQSIARTTSTDQRKINSIYEPVRNAATGNTTVYVTKRPGVKKSPVSLGVSTQLPYLTSVIPGTSTSFVGQGQCWILGVSTNTVIAAGATSTIPIVTSTSTFPAFVTRGLINSADTLVLQTRTDISNAQQAWYSTGAAFSQITDPVFTGLAHRGKLEILDGYGFIMDQTNKIYNSNINDLTVWPSNNFISKSIEMDVPRGLARLGNQILAFGVETFEVFYNAGNQAGSPLQSIPQLAGRVGMHVVESGGRTHYYCVAGGKLYFIGHGSTMGESGVFVYDGRSAQKVSSPTIDKWLFGEPDSVNFFYMATVSVFGQQAVAISLNSLAVTTPTATWLMYFPEWNEWFEWTSTVFAPMNCGPYFMGIRGGSNSLPNRLYNFSVTVGDWQDDGNDYTFTHQFKLPSKGNHRKFMRMCGVIGDTARSTTTLPLSVSFSDDDWQTFQSARNIDMTAGKKHIYRCGAYTDRGVQLSHTGNLEVRLEKFVAKIDE